MKRLLRYAFNIATMTSLLLCFLVVFEWIRSYTYIDAIGVRRETWRRPDLVHIQYCGIRFMGGYWQPEVFFQDMPASNPTTSPAVANQPTIEVVRKSYPGGIHFFYGAILGPEQLPPGAGSIRSVGFQWLGARPNRYGFGFGVGHGTPTPGGARVDYAVVIPQWLPLAITLILPLSWLTLFCFKRKRVAEGCCAKCGYDLRATPERCPECGTVPIVTP